MCSRTHSYVPCLILHICDMRERKRKKKRQKESEGVCGRDRESENDMIHMYDMSHSNLRRILIHLCAMIYCSYARTEYLKRSKALSKVHRLYHM